MGRAERDELITRIADLIKEVKIRQTETNRLLEELDTQLRQSKALTPADRRRGTRPK